MSIFMYQLIAVLFMVTTIVLSFGILRELDINKRLHREMQDRYKESSSTIERLEFEEHYMRMLVLERAKKIGELEGTIEGLKRHHPDAYTDTPQPRFFMDVSHHDGSVSITLDVPRFAYTVRMSRFDMQRAPPHMTDLNEEYLVHIVDVVQESLRDNLRDAAHKFMRSRPLDALYST